MKVAILGSGAFGLSLATLFKKCSHDVTIYTAIEEEYKEIVEKHTHEKVLKGVFLDQDLKVTMKIEEAVKGQDLILIAVPTNIVRIILNDIKPFLTKESCLLFVSKGLEEKSGKTVSEIKEEIIKDTLYGCLAGPTFAKELLENIPAGMTLATKDVEVKEKVQRLFNPTKVELEIIEDILGLEYCGAIKNTLAILMGAFLTKYSYDTVKNYLLVKMLREEERLLPLFGGKSETAMTYAGIGDLYLTCTSNKSRNFTYGANLILKKEEELTTVEGKNALTSFLSLLEEKKITTSIFHDIKLLIDDEITFDEMLEHLRK